MVTKMGEECLFQSCKESLKKDSIEGKGPVHVHLVMSKDLRERMEINMHKLGRNKRGKYNEKPVNRKN